MFTFYNEIIKLLKKVKKLSILILKINILNKVKNAV